MDNSTSSPSEEEFVVSEEKILPCKEELYEKIA